MRASWAPRSGREERNAVVVVVIPERHEHASVDEPGGFTVARAFLDRRQRETELAEPGRSHSLRW